MRVTLGKGWRWLAGLFMGLLGFAGCGKLGIFKAEYGCPNADFRLVGDVKDAKGKGIEGIRVVFTPDPEVPEEQQEWESDTLYSDARGHFERERLKHNWPDGAQKATVKFEDVDGSDHGSFRTKVLDPSELTVEQTRKGDKKWYSGEFTIRADAVLEEGD